MKNKNLFSTPLKATLTIVSLFVIIALLITGTLYGTRAYAKGSSIGEEKAKMLSFADAGVDPATAKVVKTDFEYENGHFAYEVDFIADSTEYEYWIKAKDGTILEKSIDSISSDNKKVTTSVKLTLEKAKEIALSDANLAGSAVTFTTAALDTDDGIAVYDIEFNTASTEYEYEIDANTGKIHDKNIETIQNNTVNNNQTVTDTGSSNDNSSKYIGYDKAKSIAVKDAGLTLTNVTFIKADLDTDDGITVYDIEFKTDKTEYDYEINATTGKIHDKNVKSIQNNTGNNQNTTNDDKTNDNTNKYIGIDKAKSIAVKDAGRTISNVSFTKAELDTDDGIAVYDIEFNADKTEYEYEINATTGKIHDKSVESLKNNSNNNQNGASDDKINNNSSKYIGIDKAKSIAVKHAGLSLSDVTFTKAKLDTEDGTTVYDIEFHKDGIEYNYEIDATSGKIHDYDADKQD